MGFSTAMWYPDPYAMGHKGIIEPFKTDALYLMRTCKGPVFLGALCCGAFSLTECVVESMRDEKKESTWVNAGFGGAVAGALMGSMQKRIDMMLVAGMSMGILMAMVEYNGQKFSHMDYHIEQNWIPKIAPGEQESDIVKELKAKYPEYRNVK
jgi:hypothetical protein